MPDGSCSRIDAAPQRNLNVDKVDGEPPFRCIRKRIFDLAATLLTSILWLPAVTFATLAILLLEGRPVFYVSPRRVFRSKIIKLMKLRTMIRNAAAVANRQTVPINDTRFLNISPESKLYTRIGRCIELLHWTELPQFFHVLSGKMSIVGNRPLPQDVVLALREAFPYVERRFDVPCGMTGPVQLIGRENIRDEDRLAIEIAYTIVCQRSYTIRLDILILVMTVIVALRIVRQRTPAEVISLMQRYSGIPMDELLPPLAPPAVPHRVHEAHEQADMGLAGMDRQETFVAGK